MICTGHELGLPFAGPAMGCSLAGHLLAMCYPLAIFVLAMPRIFMCSAGDGLGYPRARNCLGWP
jgi:hypothetical protein